MHALKIENIGNAKSTTRTLKLNETESLHGGLPRNGFTNLDGRVVDEATGRLTGEVLGNFNADGTRGIFAGGQAVAEVGADGVVRRNARDSGFRVTPGVTLGNSGVVSYNIDFVG